MNNTGGRWNCLWTLTSRLTGRQAWCAITVSWLETNEITAWSEQYVGYCQVLSGKQDQAWSGRWIPKSIRFRTWWQMIKIWRDKVKDCYQFPHIRGPGSELFTEQSVQLTVLLTPHLAPRYLPPPGSRGPQFRQRYFRKVVYTRNFNACRWRQILQLENVHFFKF